MTLFIIVFPHFRQPRLQWSNNKLGRVAESIGLLPASMHLLLLFLIHEMPSFLLHFPLPYNSSHALWYANTIYFMTEENLSALSIAKLLKRNLLSIDTSWINDWLTEWLNEWMKAPSLESSASGRLVWPCSLLMGILSQVLLWHPCTRRNLHFCNKNM